MNSLPINDDEARLGKPSRPLFRTIKRVASYMVFRSITLLLAVAAGLYLTIMVANFGGYIDKIFEGRINETILGMLRGGWLRDVPLDQREVQIEAMRWELEESYGLHEPFLLRTWNWLIHGLTLDFGNTRHNYSTTYISSASRTNDIQSILKLALPYTLILIGGANLLVFLISLAVSMRISRNYGGFWDRLIVALSPLSSVPAWVHGIWLIILFSAQLRILPFPKHVEILMAENWVEYLPFLARYMVLPFLAIFISAIFQTIYYWRSYFLIYSGEDYVEMARAKGLPNSRLERTHILRPSLPYILTNFSLTMIGLWQGAIALEVLFYWQGIGQLFLRAVRFFDTPMVVAIVVCFAYLLVITVFILDVLSAILDPRIQIGSVSQTRTSFTRSQGIISWLRRKKTDAPVSLGAHSTREKKTLDEPGETSYSSTSRPKRESLWQRISPVFLMILRNPAALISSLLILFLIAVSIGTAILVPYDQAVAMWRREERAFIENPRLAPPVWTNIFRRDKLPETLVMDSQDDVSTKVSSPLTEDMNQIDINFSFDYDYGAYPKDMVIFMSSQYSEKQPLIDLTWIKPDGEELNLGRFSIQSTTSFYVLQDARVKSRFGDQPLSDRLFRDMDDPDGKPLKGNYTLRLLAFTFEEDSDFDARMVVYGQVHGWAGTDNMRRDLTLALLWGTPVALAFGLIGAVATTLLSMLIAALGAWFGGWVDEVIQRISDVNLILPVLPMAIMVFIMYSKSIWAILGVVVLLNIFGNGIKVFRSAFLQIREQPYIEAAQAYGAGNWRIIMNYLVPRMIPILVPQFVIMVPGYVFFEVTLAFLGVSDPYIPTWGKMIYEALTVSWFGGNYYWIVQPVALLLITALAFAMLGFTLDRILNPRLREH